MDNLNDLKKIWLSAKTDSLPSSKEMVAIIKNYRDKKIRKKAMLIAVAAFAMVFMLLVLLITQPAMISTYIGGACIMIACGILIYTNTWSLQRMYRLKNCTNKEFLDHLQQAQKNRIYYHTKTQVWALLFVSAGILLYPYEMVHKKWLAAVVLYVPYVSYILVIWLVIRPRAYKKQTKQFNETVRKITALSEQIKEL